MKFVHVPTARIAFFVFSILFIASQIAHANIVGDDDRQEIEQLPLSPEERAAMYQIVGLVECRRGEDRIGRATGVVIDGGRNLLTVAHLITEGSRKCTFTKRQSQQLIPFELESAAVGTTVPDIFREDDWAIVPLKSKLTTPVFRLGTAPRQGEELLVVGVVTRGTELDKSKLIGRRCTAVDVLSTSVLGDCDRAIPTGTNLAELVFSGTRTAFSGDFDQGTEAVPRQMSLHDNISSPPSHRSGPTTLPLQAHLPRPDLPGRDSFLHLRCKVSHTEAVIESSGIVSERRYDDKELLITVNKHAATISIHGINAEGRSQHYRKARITEYQVDAEKVDSKGGLTAVHGITLSRLNGAVTVISESWRDPSRFASLTHEYTGVCKAAAKDASVS